MTRSGRLSTLLTMTPVLAALAACQPAAPPPPPARAVDLVDEAMAAAELIEGEQLRRIVTELASDAMGGRGPGSEGDAAARALLAAELESLGLEPGAGHGWEQPFEMVGMTHDVPAEWAFTSATGKTRELDFYGEFIAGSGVQEPIARATDAELVFVGYGIQAPEYEWDDFAGVDVAGKMLVILNNDPDWDPDLFAGNRRLYYGRWTYKYEKAAELGAAGAIIIHTTPSAGYPFQVVQTSWTGEQFELPAEGEPRVPIKAWLTEDAARELLAFAGHDLDDLTTAARERDFSPRPLGLTTSLEIQNQVRRVETANVLGLLRGRDPELAEEVVIYTAHHDHLGQDETADGDGIFNGALDNATGCSEILAVARAFVGLSSPPRRSVLFAFVGAEEQGLLGSKYYAAHPTFPPGRIAAAINLDGGNIWGRTRDVSFIGYEKSDLGPLADQLAARQGRVVKPDQLPDRGSFYRSDQFSFARIGVPAMYLDPGLDFVDRPEGWGQEQVEAWEATHYHQPSDEIQDDWDFSGMVEDARIAFWAGVQLAEQDALPTWAPGDEFEATRLAALAAADAETP